MIEKVRGLSIKGRCFNDETKLQFYEKENDRIALVYGKNGSGKSTVSQGIVAAYKGSSVPDIVASLLDKDNNTLDCTDADNIFVFNEDYIYENIRIDDDGLGTIVLFGKQVELQAEIDKYESLKNDAEADMEKLCKECEQYEDKANPLSPKHHMKIIIDTLKKEGGWAERDSKIKGNKQNSAVSEKIVEKEFLELKPTLAESELTTRYKEKWKILTTISDTNSSYPEVIQQIKCEKDIERNICEILAKKIEKLEFTEREQQIFSMITAGRQMYVEDAHEDFSKPDVEFCPYCYQPIDEEYKHGLIENINHVLNKDVEEHKKELSKILFPKFQEDYSVYSELDNDLVKEILAQESICKNIIKEYEERIKRKIGSIYIPITDEPLGLEQAVISLNNFINKLEGARINFNNAIQGQKDLINELVDLNKQMAYFEISQAIEDYKKQQNEHTLKKEECAKKESYYKNIEDKLRDLKQRQSTKNLAPKNINNALDYVFYSQERLSIELRDDKYYLKSKGKHVKPKDISTGERNIIALCYFFTQIASNQNVSELYNKEMFVVIDDPISSFDFENRVGIVSLLRYQINRIIWGNVNSKVLVLSHDLVTVFDMHKALQEICSAHKGEAKYPKTSFAPRQIVNNGIEEFKQKRNEYGELLKKIYKYINDDKDEDNIIIGNVMRRTLEVFSTFSYRKSIIEVSNEPTVLDALGEYSTYFENLMYRLVLNGESHYEEQIYNLHDDTNFYEFLSVTEKKRTAKDILCFIYLLNPQHIKSYFPNDDISTVIKGWIKNIPKDNIFEGKETVDEKASSKDLIDRTSTSKRKIRLYDIPLSAGIGNDIFSNEVPYKEYETDNKVCDFALKISGNSMEPKIPDGSIALIKQREELENGTIGAFYYNGKVFCKKFNSNDGEVWLVSLNKKSPDFEISENDIFKIYGEVVEVIEEV